MGGLPYVLAVAGIILTAGCSSGPWSAGPPASRGIAGPGAEAVLPTVPTASSPETAAPDGSQAQAMQEVMTELQQLGALDRAAQEKLMADLRQTDPALWPLVLQQFRAAMAYRRRAEQREMATAGGDHVSPPPAGTVARHPGQPVSLESRQPEQVPGASEPAGVRVDRLPAAGSAALAPSHAPEGRYPSTPDLPVSPPPANGLPESRQASAAVGQVISASYDPAAAGDWRGQLALAARTLESQIEGTPGTQEEIAQHARLRMLYLLSGQRDKALLPIPAVAPATEEFWSKQIYGLDTWLDTKRVPDATLRAAETKRILGEALGRLGESAPLEIRSLAFCTKIHSYGCIERFRQNEFAPGEQVLLYAEVENFASESTAKGAHTALRSRYAIYDVQGRRLADHSFTKTEEYCQRPRRDFFIGYHLRLPGHLAAGKYTLQLTIEDLKSKKVGQSSIELSIKGVADR